MCHNYLIRLTELYISRARGNNPRYSWSAMQVDASVTKCLPLAPIHGRSTSAVQTQAFPLHLLASGLKSNIFSTSELIKTPGSLYVSPPYRTDVIVVALFCHRKATRSLIVMAGSPPIPVKWGPKASSRVHRATQSNPRRVAIG